MFSPILFRCLFRAMLLVLVFAFSSPAFAGKPEDDQDDKRDASSPSLNWKRQSASTQAPGSPGDFLGKPGGHDGSLFWPGEVQIIGFGAGGYGQDTHNVTQEHQVSKTETITETHFVPKTTYVTTVTNSRLGPIVKVTPVQTSVPVTTKRQVTTTTTVKTTKNVAGIQGGFGGAGLEARYFFTRLLGLGVEGDWLEGEGSSGTTMATITARLIKGSNAYYGFGGSGVQFNEHFTQAVGKIGIGVEHRFVAGTGVFADAAWMFGSQENAAMFRGGFKFSF
jgi:hypothetical protein